MKINARLYRVLLKIMIALVVIVIVGTVAFVVMTVIGRNNLYGKNKGKSPDLTGFEGAELLADEDVLEGVAVEAGDYVWQEGDVRYNGDIYRYNDDILTFFFMGIDKKTEVKLVEDGINGGQSDANFLLVLNPRTEEISIIAIPRDTETEIDMYDEYGNFIAHTRAQLCLQHGYGDGGALSCERSVNAVSGLFYGLPIHGYCAINMGGIPLLNDAIGGVEVVALQDVIKSDIKKGDTILLQGEMAYDYLHNRDTSVFASAEDRLARQRQYLIAYIAKAKAAVKQDITLAVKLYNTLSKYMVTDVTVDEVSYLATKAAGYSFDTDRIYVLEGEVETVRNYERFYADEEALYELILQVFYEKVAAGE